METITADLPIFDTADECLRQLGSLILSGAKKIDLPLAGVDISAKVIDRIAQVTVKQIFRNTLSEHMEAVYIFPLAPGSAISSFIMKVGDRTINGVVEERGEARRQYQQALETGHRAALMEQERDDVFTVQVGNLPPGEEVTIELTYSEKLPFYENGSCELRLPLLVAPRYIPGRELNRESVGDGTSLDTDLVPDASRISPPRLAPGVDPKTALTLKVEILADEDAQISDLSCSQHAMKTTFASGEIVVKLAKIDEKLNRDFVLRWHASAENMKTSLLTYTAEDGETYGLLSIMPPKRAGFLGAARDILFLVDRSGSMSGIKMTSAIRSCSILLSSLGPQDRFAIASFDNVVEWMPNARSAKFIHADEAGIEKGEKFLRDITDRGGTEMDNALGECFSAIAGRPENEGRMPSLVVLTDGEVGDESQILKRVQQQIGDSRLFVVGIDTAVNSGLLKRLANLGGGTAAFVEPGIQLEEALSSIAREIGAPLVTDIQVEDLDLEVERASFSPSRIPDIFAGRSSVCFLKVSSGKGKILVKGRRADSKPFEVKVKAQNVAMPCIAQLWAKYHVVDLEDQFRLATSTKPALKKQIIDIAVKHSILTKFTAFVVIDDSEVVNQTGDMRKVVQPVEEPDQWAGNVMPQAPQLMGSLAPVAMPRLAKLQNVYFEPSVDLDGYSGGAVAGGNSDWGAPLQEAAAQDCAWGDPSSAECDAFMDASQILTGSFAQYEPAERCEEASPVLNESSQSVDAKDTCSKREVSGVGSEAAPAKAPIQHQSPLKKLASLFGAKRADESSDSMKAQSISNEAQSVSPPAASPKQKSRSVASPMQHQSSPSAPPPVPPVPPAAPKPLSHAASSAPAGGAAPPPAAPGNVKELRGKSDSNLADDLRARSGLKSLQESAAPSTKPSYDAFFNEFKEAFKQLEQNNLPDAAKLESARSLLLKTLAPLKVGMELPLLQKFLRSSAVEMVASLKNTALNIREILDFWNTKLALFNELEPEIQSVLNKKEVSFWDECI